MSFLAERSAFIRGAVRRQGAYPVAEGTTLDSLLSDGCGAPARLDVELEAGQFILIIASDFVNPADIDCGVACGDDSYYEMTVDCGVASDCPQDLSGNGEVDFEDILTVLAHWGEDGSMGGDTNDDDYVDFKDILNILGAWGPCP